MSKRFPALVAALALALSAPLAAQGRSAVSPADLDAAIATRQSETRRLVEQFVNTAEVRVAAEKLGISQATLSAKVAELDSTKLNAVARQIALAEEPLAGGFSILGIGLVRICSSSCSSSSI
jgi:ribosome-binding protein aMBF1 (putative translation factor)